jgi:hypothetical protein
MARRSRSPESSASSEEVTSMPQHEDSVTENPTIEHGGTEDPTPPVAYPHEVSPSEQSDPHDDSELEVDPDEHQESPHEVPPGTPEVPQVEPPSWTIDPNATPLEKFSSYKVPHVDDFGSNGGLMLGEFCVKCATPAQYPILDKWLLDCALD